MQKKINILALIFNLFLFISLRNPLKANTPEESQIEQGGENTNIKIVQVLADKVIVYADESMNTPIGFISKNKLITVGLKRKKNPDLVPLAVYGRVAYIETKNINYDAEPMEIKDLKKGPLREHDIDIVLNKAEDRMTANNSFYLSIQQLNGGDEIKNLTYSIDGSNEDQFKGFNLFLLHRDLPSRFFWGMGYEYFHLSTPSVNFTLNILNPIWGYTLIKSSHFYLDFNFTFDFVPASKIEFPNSARPDVNPIIYGPTISTRLLFFPESKHHAFFTIGLRRYKVSNFEGVSLLSGPYLALGYAVEI